MFAALIAAMLAVIAYVSHLVSYLFRAKERTKKMSFDGMKTIYDEEVAYVPNQGAPQALTPKYMMNFCSQNDAAEILPIAQQAVPAAILVGGTTDFVVTWNPGTSTLTPGPDAIYAQADSSGGRYMYGSSDGYRPLRVQSIQDGLDQFVAEIVASWDGSKSNLSLQNTAQGKKLIWV